MENIENLKKTNKALIVGNVVLGCLLIVAMAFLAILVIDNANVTASAATENYLNEQITITNEDQETPEDDYIKTSAAFIEGLYNGEKLEFHYTLNGVNGKVYGYAVEVEGMILIVKEPTLNDNGDNNIIINDNVRFSIYPYLNVNEGVNGSTWCVMKNENLDTFSLTFTNVKPAQENSIENLISSAVVIDIPDTGEGQKLGMAFLQPPFVIKENQLYTISYSINNGDVKSITALGYLSGEGLSIGDFSDNAIIIDQENYTFLIIMYDTDENGTQDYNSPAVMIATSATEDYKVTLYGIYEGETAGEPGKVVVEPIKPTEIIGNITDSFTTFLTGTGEGIVNFFQTLFLNQDGKISTLAIVGLSMMGLGLAMGVIKILMSRAG